MEHIDSGLSRLSPEADGAIRALRAMELDVTIVERDVSWIRIEVTAMAGTRGAWFAYIAIDGRLMEADEGDA